MAIKVRCAHCNARFTAKDQLAGRNVKCPKCTQMISVPAKKPAASKAVAPAAAAHNPLLDLLDEAGVEAMPRGPVCENCAAAVPPHAIICVECGYNMATGELMETSVFDEDDGVEAGGMTDAQKIMAKAEKEIEDMPVSMDEGDFGDGADSFLIAGVAVVILGILVAIGVGTIFLMDQIGDYINSSVISFWASMTLAVGCAIWITIVAFLTKSSQGVICLCTLGIYCIIFGFMQGRALILPTVIMCASLFIGFVSSFFAFADDGGVIMLMQQLVG